MIVIEGNTTERAFLGACLIRSPNASQIMFYTIGYGVNIYNGTY